MNTASQLARHPLFSLLAAAQFFARSDTSNVNIQVVRISGYKRASDNIALTCIPGS